MITQLQGSPTLCHSCFIHDTIYTPTITQQLLCSTVLLRENVYTLKCTSFSYMILTHEYTCVMHILIKVLNFSRPLESSLGSLLC